MLGLRRVRHALSRRRAAAAGPGPRGPRARRLLSPPDRVAAAAVSALDATAPTGPLGLAVSGGGDSIALLLIGAEWARARGRALAVATVDHGLRPEAAHEAAAVRARAAALGLPAVTLRWRAPDRRGGQAAFRAARTALLAEWAAETGLSAVALGHTRDDQAETVLLRLARGAGVDGLSAMAPATRRAGVLWLRPLLSLGRAELRAWLAARGERWADDPSNDDPRYARTTARRALSALAPLGVDAAALAATADRLRSARAALAAHADALWAVSAERDVCGGVRLNRAALRAAPDETARRVIARAFAAATGRALPPRARGLEPLTAALRGAAPLPWRSLAGALSCADADAASVVREPSATISAVAADGLWDGRWCVESTGPGVVAALGAPGEAALAQARGAGWTPPPAWRAAPRFARQSSPALWDGPRLVCAPAAAYGAGLTARLAPEPCVDTPSGGLI